MIWDILMIGQEFEHEKRKKNMERVKTNQKMITVVQLDSKHGFCSRTSYEVDDSWTILFNQTEGMIDNTAYKRNLPIKYARILLNSINKA